MYLCHKFFRRNFYVMMLEEELKKRMFLTKCGVFSVRKNSRELLESLHYAAELLKNPRNVVTVYPAGELISQHWQQFPFQRGFSRLANSSENQPLIAFAVILVDYFSLARPEIRVYLKNYQGERTPEAVEVAYREFYQTCVSKQTA
jgi:1-acyl-sn-glycerol-3-phosphate acyltransferase